MSFEFNPNIYPPGGYQFKERDGTVIRGDTWKNLNDRIRVYREVNHFEAGDPHRDVMDQMCKTYPHMCGIVDNTPMPPNGRGQAMNFTDRVLHWFIQILSLKRLNRLSRVDDQTAGARANICQRCPRQMALSAACGACTRSIDQGRLAALDGQPSRHQNLLSCAVLGEDTSITVHIGIDPVENKDLPRECWRRKK